MSRFTHMVRAGCVLALLAGTAAAEQIYRSVDAEGNVTFSNQPPADAVSVDQVDVQPEPSEAAQREAQERMQRQEAAANEMGEANARRAQQQQQQQPQASPTVPETVEPVEPVNQYYVDPERNRFRDRLPERPTHLPARPVQPPARPVQQPARPVAR